MCKKSLWIWVALTTLFLTAGYALSAAAAAPSYRTPEIAISELSSNEYSPNIAYNPTHNEYLVVWENDWSDGHHNIYGRRISADGRLLDGFLLASGAYKQMNPAVAYDPTRDRYLVVFAYDYYGNGSDWDIHGRFIPWNGPTGALLDFSICDNAKNQAKPVVAFGQAQDEFMVAWKNDGPPAYLRARRIFADGSGFPTNTPFVVSSGPEVRDYLAIAYNLARNEYLVTWDMPTSSGLDIYAIRLSGTGTALTGGDPSVTGQFPIAGWPAHEGLPAVAACAAADQYLVAWQSDQDTGGADYAIYARYLNGDAVPGNVYLVSDTGAPQLNPDVACGAGGQKYLLAWQDKYVGGEYGIWGRYAYSDEAFDSEFEIDGPRAESDREVPAVSGGRANFLAAWEHDRDGGTNLDIRGRLLGYFVYLPLSRR